MMTSVPHTMRAIKPALSRFPRIRPRLQPLSQRPLQRSFHVGPAIGAALQGTQDLVVSFHELAHTPWFLTIPLIAVGISVLFRLPFSIYTQKIHQRRAALSPVLQAWNARIQYDIDAERVPPARRETEARTRFAAVSKRVWKRFGLQDWKLFTNVLGLPFWLLGIDAIRRLCGGPRGILGHFVFGAGEAPQSISGSEKGELADSAVSASGTSSIPSGSLPGPDPSAAIDVADTVMHAAAEPSLATGGILWFPDLTVADPWHVLPFALSAILVANLWPSTNAGWRALLNMDPRPPSPDSKAPSSSSSSSSAENRDSQPINGSRNARIAMRLQRGMLPVSLLLGPLTMDLPAALHLYWITSATASWATKKILTRAYPLSGHAVPPCTGVEVFTIRPKRQAEEAGDEETSAEDPQSQERRGKLRRKKTDETPRRIHLEYLGRKA